jgi:hypothetical protein
MTEPPDAPSDARWLAHAQEDLDHAAVPVSRALARRRRRHGRLQTHARDQLPRCSARRAGGTAASDRVRRRRRRGAVVDGGSLAAARRNGVCSRDKFAVLATAEGLRRSSTTSPCATTIAVGYVDTPIGDGERDHEFSEALAMHGMPPSTVADQIVTALAAPREAAVVELAVPSTGEE